MSRLSNKLKWLERRLNAITTQKRSVVWVVVYHQCLTNDWFVFVYGCYTSVQEALRFILAEHPVCEVHVKDDEEEPYIVYVGDEGSYLALKPYTLDGIPTTDTWTSATQAVLSPKPHGSEVIITGS